MWKWFPACGVLLNSVGVTVNSMKRSHKCTAGRTWPNEPRCASCRSTSSDAPAPLTSHRIRLCTIVWPACLAWGLWNGCAGKSTAFWCCRGRDSQAIHENRYYSAGYVFGLVCVAIACVLHVIAVFLEWLEPRASIEVCWLLRSLLTNTPDGRWWLQRCPEFPHARFMETRVRVVPSCCY